MKRTLQTIIMFGDMQYGSSCVFVMHGCGSVEFVLVTVLFQSVSVGLIKAEDDVADRVNCLQAVT